MTGRPTLYKEQYCDAIINFMADGKSITAFAASIGHHRQILHQWAKTHPKFKDAIRQASELAEAYWEKELAKASRGEVLDVIPTGKNSVHLQRHNVLALMFLMKARFKTYRDQMDEFDEEEESYETPESLKDTDESSSGV